MSLSAPTVAPTRKIVAANLIVERARAGLSQTALANAAGVSRQTISEIERGVTNPTIDVIDQIVTVLGTPIERLFVQHRPGIVDNDEVARRRATGREDTVEARALFDAIDEAAGRAPRRYSSAGRRRVER